MTTSSIIDELNTVIVPTEDFTYDSNDDGFNIPECEYVGCCECSRTFLKIEYTGNGTSSIDTKLAPGLYCQHCGRAYCSYAHMKPKILVKNSEEIEPITGLKSCVIYQICKAYLSTLPLKHENDPFCYNGEHIDGDEEYCFPLEMDYPIRRMVGFDFTDISGTLYEEVGIEKKIKKDVIEFIDAHFNDKMTRGVEDYKWYKNCDAIKILSVFTGCGRCLNNISQENSQETPQ